jgi:hypothetical protein
MVGIFWFRNYFQYENNGGLGARLMDRGGGGLGPPWTTRRRGPEAAGARRRARRSSVPDRSRARKLTGEGRPWRGEDGEAGATLTRAREALWWPGNDGKSAAGEELGGGGVGPRRREEEEGDECGEDW